MKNKRLRVLAGFTSTDNVCDCFSIYSPLRIKFTGWLFVCTKQPLSQVSPLNSRCREGEGGGGGKGDERPWERCCIHYLFVLSEENVLPVHVIPARFVRQVAYISQFLFFKLSYNCRVKFREKFLVFHKWCFTTAAFSSLLQAEEDHLQKKWNTVSSWSSKSVFSRLSVCGGQQKIEGRGGGGLGKKRYS